jgi:LEA14-like dessication related protein
MTKISVVLALLISIVSCTKPKDLEFIDIQNIRMIKVGLSESQLGLDLRLYNPNNQRVQMKDAAAKIYVNSTYMGDSRMDTTIQVPRRDTFAIPLVISVKTITGLSNVMQSLSDSVVNIKVEGTVKMGKAGVFKSFPVNFDKRQKVADLMNGKLSLD